MAIKITSILVGGLAITLALGIRDAAIPEGHLEVSIPAESTVVRGLAPQATNVAAGISSLSFDPKARLLL